MKVLDVSQADILRSEYRLMKAECERLQHKRRRLVKWGLLGPVVGVALGAFGMVYVEPPKPQPVSQDQRVKEMRFSLQKLERLKDVHDATLREAATNQGEIRQMVKELGVGK